MPVAQQEQTLTAQENTLAVAMLHRIGDATIRYAMDADSESDQVAPMLTGGDFHELVGNFVSDPVESLGWARDALFAISKDESLPEQARASRLSEFLDAYFDLTIKLDQAAFSDDEPGAYHERVPSYIPDGFVDMGRDARHDPAVRDREQIWVDKREILEKYKPLLTRIFQHDYSNLSEGDRPLNMSYSIAKEVYQSIPLPENVQDGDLGLGGGKIKLSEIEEAVCRHRALIFQVLGQAIGLDSRVIKGPRMTASSVENHAANMVRSGDKWYLVDVSNPYMTYGAQGQEIFLPAAYELEGGPLARAEARRLSFTRSTWGEVPKVRYIARDDMYWHVEHHER
ncbi:MAG TPA: EDR1-related protein [Patescibacteria group bacterium]|nr:EDR1-related protein [Patescibacteria group bacterium]